MAHTAVTTNNETMRGLVNRTYSVSKIAQHDAEQVSVPCSPPVTLLMVSEGRLDGPMPTDYHRQ